MIAYFRVFLPSTSESGEEPSPPSSKLPEPDLKALALLLEKEDATLPSMIDMADSSVFWRLNSDTAALMLRDKLIVEVKLLLLMIFFAWFLNHLLILPKDCVIYPT